MLLAHLSLAVLPILGLPSAPRDCQLEVLTRQTIEERTIAEFHAKVDAYARLHRHFVRALPAMPRRGEEGWLAADELRAALVAARPHARQGGFFTPAAADIFRARIDHAPLLHAAAPPAPLYEPLTGEPSPMVNEPFLIPLPSTESQALTNALPALPSELAYAFWGRDLVLVDVPAGLVIDVLPDALAEGGRPGTVYQ
jgi:hypothetical protein